jgi:hypothetical protein
MELEGEFAPDLITKAREFADDMTGVDGFWKGDGLGSFPKGNQAHGIHAQENIDLADFIELHPDLWMSHASFENGIFAGPTAAQFAYRFAHILLQDDPAKYHVVESDGGDARIFEYIGLCGAGTSGSRLGIEEIPALIDYTIHEYDGMEEVQYP